MLKKKQIKNEDNIFGQIKRLVNLTNKLTSQYQDLNQKFVESQKDNTEFFHNMKKYQYKINQATDKIKTVLDKYVDNKD